MIAAILFATLAVAGIAGSIVAVVRDGYRPVRTDGSRVPSPHR